MDAAIAAGAEDWATDILAAVTSHQPMAFETFARSNLAAWSGTGNP